MCMYPYENPYAEKTNDLINNGYLNIWRPKSLVGLRKHQHMAVRDHNTKSRKKVLGNLSPIEFKRTLLNNQLNTRNYKLLLRPVVPEQPKNKQLSLINS
jgi:putative transposase